MEPIIGASEQPRDYPWIAALHLRAFGDAGVAHLVALLRQSPRFDPELSLVAISDAGCVGHVLFMPVVMRLMDSDWRALILSPIGIDPAFQRQGIGSALIEAGHERARHHNYNYDFSILLGHPEYYPRFGYRTGAFGESACIVQRESLTDAPSLEARPPIEADLSALAELWQMHENRIDFALYPDKRLLAWLSPHPDIQCRVYLRDGEIVGYSRVNAHKPDHVREFYARPDAARAVAAALCGDQASITLPLHPASASVSALGTAVAKAWQPGMAYPLNDAATAALDAYFSALDQGQRAPGRPFWGASYDLIE